MEEGSAQISDEAYAALSGSMFRKDGIVTGAKAESPAAPISHVGGSSLWGQTARLEYEQRQ